MKRILGLIPARGGSKGILRKNLANLAGKKLIEYTIQASLNSKSLSQVILSTDDNEIALIGKSLGVSVPFIRPKSLATDKATTFVVVKHALEELLHRGEHYDAVCILQCTCPLRSAQEIDEACEQYNEGWADTLVSVRKTPHHFHPEWALYGTGDGALEWTAGRTGPPPRRQDLRTVYYRDGSIYIVSSRNIVEDGSLYGSKILKYETRGPTINIDLPEDLVRAEEMMQRDRLN